MEHVAIMKKNWGLLPKIITGQKSIESRWYQNKSAPWDKIKPGETVYFKDSGSPVTVKAEVDNVIQFTDLTPEKVVKIINQHAAAIGLELADIPRFFHLVKNKKYCILIFLKNPKKIKPFEVDKTGFGAMAAWMCVEKLGDKKNYG